MEIHEGVERCRRVRHTQMGRSRQPLERKVKIGIGVAALALGALALAQPHDKSGLAAVNSAQAKVTARLATVDPGARSRIDYARLNARVQRMVEKPTMVGMAVGIVENGRITFLNGYG